MNTKHNCSFSTFWLGYQDWWKERLSMNIPEAVVEVKREQGKYFPLKIVWALVSVVFMLIAALTLLQFAARKGLEAGATSLHLMLFAEWGTYLLIFGLAGFWTGTTCCRIKSFCHEMCERGHRIRARQIP